MDRSKEEVKGRAHYSEVYILVFDHVFLYKEMTQGVAAKESKNSSVKKLLLLGVLPECSETYGNVKLLMEKLSLDDSSIFFSGDLKMCK